jgi:hypothetical protein
MIEFVSDYHKPTCNAAALDLFDASAALRAEAWQARNILFSRSEAFKLLQAPSLLFSLYDEVLERLRPCPVDLKERHIAILKMASENPERPDSVWQAVTKAFGGEPYLDDLNAVSSDLFNMRLVAGPEVLPLDGIKITELGVIALSKSI